MNQPRVLDVGNCNPDHAAMRSMLTTHFDAEVHRVMFVHEALIALRSATFALVLVNRRIFADDSDGLDLVRAIQSDPALSATPIMLISNFPDAQQGAIAAGAIQGFGKADMDSPETLARLSEFFSVARSPGPLLPKYP